MKLVYGAVFFLLVVNIALWGALSYFAPQGKIEGVPYLVILGFDLHLAAYLAWVYFRIRKQTILESV